MEQQQQQQQQRQTPSMEIQRATHTEYPAMSNNHEMSTFRHLQQDPVPNHGIQDAAHAECPAPNGQVSGPYPPGLLPAGPYPREGTGAQPTESSRLPGTTRIDANTDTPPGDLENGTPEQTPPPSLAVRIIRAFPWLFEGIALVVGVGCIVGMCPRPFLN